MTLRVLIDPRNVNFGWISILEVPGPASGVSGYFAALAAAGTDISHHPNPAFTRIGFNNSVCCDTASGTGFAPPWSAGAFRWSIPNRYRCSNSTGAGHLFATSVQTFAITAAGQVTVTKQGQTVTRTP